MRPWIAAGVGLVVLALACYTIGTAAHQRELRVTSRALRFLSAGLVLDAVGTLCMVLGTQSRGVTSLRLFPRTLCARPDLRSN